MEPLGPRSNNYTSSRGRGSGYGTDSGNGSGNGAVNCNGSGNGDMVAGSVGGGVGGRGGMVWDGALDGSDDMQWGLKPNSSGGGGGGFGGKDGAMNMNLTAWGTVGDGEEGYYDMTVCLYSVDLLFQEKRELVLVVHMHRTQMHPNIYALDFFFVIFFESCSIPYHFLISPLPHPNVRDLPKTTTKAIGQRTSLGDFRQGEKERDTKTDFTIR